MTESRIGSVIAFIGTIIIAVATLHPTPGAPPMSHGCVICGELGGVDAVLNVLLFVPLGFGLGLRHARYSRALAIIALATALVEALQLSVIPGRSATLGDLVTNTLGGSIGYFMGSRWRLLVWPSPPVRRLFFLFSVMVPAGVLLLTGVSLQPSPTTGVYYGHQTRPYLDEPAFPGTVHAANVGPCIVTNTSVDDHFCVHGALKRGESFSADVSARGTTPIPVAIVRVVDERQSEIAMLGADRDRAIFSVRTVAAALGLRPYRFALDSVFSEGPREVRLAGTFIPSSATITALVAGRPRQISLRLGPASGWLLFIPLRYYNDGSPIVSVLGGLWMALLIFPVGYWRGSSTIDSRQQWETILMAALIGGSLLMCPLLFGTAAPSLTDVLAGMVGLAAGKWARRRVERVDRSISFRRPQSS